MMWRSLVVLQTGQVKEEKEVHEKQINDLKMAPDGTHFITASSDKTAKLVDTQTLEVGLHLALATDFFLVAR